MTLNYQRCRGNVSPCRNLTHGSILVVVLSSCGYVSEEEITQLRSCYVAAGRMRPENRYATDFFIVGEEAELSSTVHESELEISRLRVRTSPFTVVVLHINACPQSPELHGMA
uniref:Uncharacterized protein n=1 Tax=Nelumbo nucifera TaxID=4432 RepID=A0A822ZG22_NELNU|nr:TPA_asm: hypothetical protein HUJ06_014901 [Nelumbo nucifera]